MPFGLSNSPASFQRLMDVVLRAVRDFALCYIDDIVIFSDSFDNHLSHLQKVFTLLQEAGLIIKPSKCQFLRATDKESIMSATFGKGYSSRFVIAFDRRYQLKHEYCRLFCDSTTGALQGECEGEMTPALTISSISFDNTSRM